MNKNSNLLNKNFIMVVIGQMISIFGNAILRFALPLYILDKTGSTTIFGTILAISTIPTILFSPIGGILADRNNRRNLMVMLDMITAIIIILSTLLLTIGPVVIVIAVLMVIFSIIQSFYQPAVQASIPVIVSKDYLEKANGVVSLVNAFSYLIGPLAAGILYGASGIWPIMIIGAICFFFAAIMEMFISMNFVKQTKHDTTLTMICSDFKDSFHFLVKNKPFLLKVMIIVSGINLFLTSMILIGLPAMILVKLNLTSQLYGFTQGAMAAGMITGGVLISILGNKVKANKAYVMLILTSAALIPIGMAFSLLLPDMIIYLIISLCCFIMTVMITMFSISMMSLVQRETPDHLIGKVMSYILVLTQCTLPVGQAIYGFVFEIGINYISIIIYVTALFSGIIAIYSKTIFNKFYDSYVKVA